ncbi:hypothetical protein CBP13_17060 [Fischerella thermalis WC441]|nr:hypothetical protein CBP19_22385 [Fischerella thermalis WC1110]PLZ38202.1 hypothetical protein CBP26_16050 [Fischerella thermalis WC538]PLZ40487.1 hypothetical protein CBP25_19140 [Fischerella thermalis WC527]PLZ50075.1 hypothetical protein CBP13_17060 [Fischerella thermalis WC441]PLZ58577.1 hypothetical protein CBP23_21620 [Fischerella thermalis WC344]RDH47830.1 hypothetical protein CA946_18990 [Fischerella thermalis 111/344/542]
MVKSQILIIFIFFKLYLNFKLIKKIIKTLLRFKISEDIIGKIVNINFSNSNYIRLSTNIVTIGW